nr:GNAT family N-acetyltransferase [Lutispora saccharofermentans]
MLELDDFNCQENLNEDIAVLKLEKDELLPEWVKIVNEGLFGCELITVDQFTDIFELGNVHFYIGLLNNIPASACMTIKDSDTSVLEMVATLEQYRHKGLATAVINKALDDLKKSGIKTISLRAEKDGVNLYKHLGFKDCFKRIVASCDWDKVYKDSCPCRIDDETIARAQDIFCNSRDVKSFINKMNEQHVIGKTIWYNERENAVYITKLYSCECGSDCSTNNCNIRQRCHCEYVNDLNCDLPISYCKCAATFFEPLFAPLFGKNISIEPVETVLSGSEQCTFKIAI